MTWEQLYLLINDMRKAKHTSMDKPVEVVFNGGYYDVDIIESLTTGDAFLTADVRIVDEEESEDGG